MKLSLGSKKEAQLPSLFHALTIAHWETLENQLGESCFPEDCGIKAKADKPNPPHVEDQGGTSSSTT